MTSIQAEHCLSKRTIQAIKIRCSYDYMFISPVAGSFKIQVLFTWDWLGWDYSEHCV